MSELKHEMTHRLRVTGPLAATEGSPAGAREYWEMTEGSRTGARIKAKIAMPGGDWLLVSADRFWRPDVRLQFITEDGAVVLLHYTGLVEQTVAFRKAAEEGRETNWRDHYMRMQTRFETGAENYCWPNESIFIGEGRLAGPKEIGYRISRIS